MEVKICDFKIFIFLKQKNGFRFDMLGNSSSVGDMAKKFLFQLIIELTPVFRNLHFKNITVDNCQVFISRKVLNNLLKISLLKIYNLKMEKLIFKMLVMLFLNKYTFPLKQ